MCIFLWKKTSWKQREYDKILLVMDSGKHGFRVFGNTMEKWLFFKRWNWAFVYFFFAKILAYLMIFFKVECASKGPVRTLKNHEIHPKNWLKMKKSLVQYTFNTYFSWFRVPKNNDFGYPISLWTIFRILLTFLANLEMHICSMLQVCIIAIWYQGLEAWKR